MVNCACDYSDPTTIFVFLPIFVKDRQFIEKLKSGRRPERLRHILTLSISLYHCPPKETLKSLDPSARLNNVQGKLSHVPVEKAERRNVRICWNGLPLMAIFACPRPLPERDGKAQEMARGAPIRAGVWQRNQASLSFKMIYLLYMSTINGLSVR